MVFANVTLEIRGSEWVEDRSGDGLQTNLTAFDPAFDAQVDACLATRDATGLTCEPGYAWKVADISYAGRTSAARLADCNNGPAANDTNTSVQEDCGVDEIGKWVVQIDGRNPQEGSIIDLIPAGKSDEEVQLLDIQLGFHAGGVPEQEDPFEAVVTLETDLTGYENRTIPIRWGPIVTHRVHDLCAPSLATLLLRPHSRT